MTPAWDGRGYSRRDKNGIQIRGNYYHDYDDTYFEPDEARALATRLNKLADEHEAAQVPDYWPPQAGDLWRNKNGIDYFVTRPFTTKGLVFRTPVDLSYSEPHCTGRPQDWTIVYRKGITL